MFQFVLYIFMQVTKMKTNLGQMRSTMGKVHAHSNST